MCVHLEYVFPFYSILLMIIFLISLPSQTTGLWSHRHCLHFVILIMPHALHERDRIWNTPNNAIQKFIFPCENIKLFVKPRERPRFRGWSSWWRRHLFAIGYILFGSFFSPYWGNLLSRYMPITNSFRFILFSQIKDPCAWYDFQISPPHQNLFFRV